MVEITISVSSSNLRVEAIDISIVYHKNGTVKSVNWCPSIETQLATIWEIDDDYNSDEDPDYLPEMDTDASEYSSTDEE
jgi:hypothetical protein